MRRPATLHGPETTRRARRIGLGRSRPRRRPPPFRAVSRPARSAPALCGLFLAAFFLGLLRETAGALPVDIPVRHGRDDGEEVDDTTWIPDRLNLSLGRQPDGSVQDLAFRFLAPELAGVAEVVFARLRYDSRGSEITEGLTFGIDGVLEADSPPLSDERRPSLLPRTGARVIGHLADQWVNGGANPLFYYSDDLSPVLNEILALPDWPGDSAALVLCLEDLSEFGLGENRVQVAAFGSNRPPVTLQVCRTLEEAFLCHELVGRPTDRSVTVNFVPLVPMEAWVEYGVEGWSSATPPVLAPAEEVCEIVVEGLLPGAVHRYRLRYRAAGSCEPYREGATRSFRTQRPPGEPFTFTTQADSHLWESWGRPYTGASHLALYERTLENVAGDAPDFHLSLGDFSMTAYSPTWLNAFDRYATQRRFLDRVLHSIPFYLALGNHEGELGWRAVAGDSVAVWAERARLLLVPNPSPDAFYAGSADPAISGPGPRENYYAWEWGDALFVVLDPFWHTTTRPYHGGNPGEGGGWAWTLGPEQYEWLHGVVAGSDRRWKIVLLHHLTGGIENPDGSYGRGGTEVVKWEVDHRPSFEWGGQDETGADVFALRRPGFGHGPIHDLLRDAGVELVIHGHDHLCALQAWDGIVYALCPQPNDPYYTEGARAAGGYLHGQVGPNSGHLRFLVTPDDIVIECVRAYLDGDGPNGEVTMRHSVAGTGGLSAVPPAGAVRLAVAPNPAFPGAAVVFRHPSARRSGAPDELLIVDASGRLRARLRPDAPGRFTWDQRGPELREVPAGVYYGFLRGAAGSGAPVVVAR